jgi:hypothetical protein
MGAVPSEYQCIDIGQVSDILGAWIRSGKLKKRSGAGLLGIFMTGSGIG